MSACIDEVAMWMRRANRSTQPRPRSSGAAHLVDHRINYRGSIEIIGCTTPSWQHRQCVAWVFTWIFSPKTSFCLNSPAKHSTNAMRRRRWPCFRSRYGSDLERSACRPISLRRLYLPSSNQIWTWLNFSQSNPTPHLLQATTEVFSDCTRLL